MKSIQTLVFGSVPFFALFAWTTAADAAWTYRGEVQGIPTYYDTNTGLTWTVSLGRVPSADWGQQARQRVEQLGFRLPTFHELQGMYNHSHGGGVLRIRSGLLDYYETSDPNVLRLGQRIPD